MFETSKTAIPQKYFIIIAIFALVNILAINFFLQSYTTPFASDSEQYLATANYFRGLDSVIYPQRLLKPLVPAAAAVFSYIFGLGPAFLLINSVLYFFIGFIIFKIIKLLFNDDKQALIGALLYLAAYPMLEYGIVYMTDLAGWFFFAVSVYLTLLFLKKPSYNLAIFNGLLSAAGFLAKESGGMGILFFFICLFLVYKDSFVNKIKYLLSFASFFAAPFLAWQAFVYFRFYYSYYDWFFKYNEYSQPVGTYKREFFQIFIKSLGAAFLLGWIFVMLGLLKIKKALGDVKKILLALILPSFSFLLWFAASSRLYYIIGILLSILASWGIVSFIPFKKRYVLIFILTIVMAGNYFWFIFDDRLRLLINGLFGITY